MIDSAAKAHARARASALTDRFTAAGASPVEAAILQPADVLLDLYGEDIRARAYTTTDPLRGEMMLRPDFTVPVVRMHMASGAETPARYTYSGEVFRKQEDDDTRAVEYLQTGFELFGTGARADEDAEVFALIASAVADQNVTPVIGDMGLLRAAIDGLSTTPARKAALLRHIWRPRRFRRLIERFTGKLTPPPGRTALLAEADPLARFDAIPGLRTRAEIETRLATLREDAQTPPIAALEAEVLDAVLALRAAAPDAVSALRDLAVDLPGLTPAVDQLAARLEALAGHGIAVETLAFDAALGRASMEYYDGFVFAFHGPDPAQPPLATGGRYDALTYALGGGAALSAVGGMIRPDLMEDPA
ncbi:MAG: ATP phosphoribosyltransferase regulatory subunit [Rhodobacterales bacterium]|nr:MAG: ATP phosphoribosyltransferase regulatory subunit [Rhodobacterales bacterium]